MDWLSALCFRLVHRNNLVYNTCWEDPRLDRVALDFQPDDNVLVITSAGCNALDYVLAGPRRVHAVDMNPRQNALLELKIAGIRALEYDDFFSMFGRGRLFAHERVYPARLRPLLSDSAREYWDRRIYFFSGAGIRKTFYYHGTSGVFAQLVNWYVDRIARARDHIDQILDTQSIDEQRALYYGALREAIWTRFVRWCVAKDSTLSLLGVPRPQRKQVERYVDGGIAEFIEQCLDAVFATLPLQDNYFWRVYLCGEYSPNCCPEYLKRENFERLRDGLVDRVSVHTATVESFLQSHRKPIDKFVLLDHMDWLASAHHHLLVREWQAIVQRAAPRARLIWRSGGMHVDFVDPVRVRINGTPWRVGDLLTYNRSLAEELHAIDRVHTYGSLHIADLAVA